MAALREYVDTSGWFIGQKTERYRRALHPYRFRARKIDTTFEIDTTAILSDLSSRLNAGTGGQKSVLRRDGFVDIPGALSGWFNSNGAELSLAELAQQR
jgi:hypothetical protein